MSPNFLIYFQMEKFLRTTLEMHVILERAHLNVQITIHSVPPLDNSNGSVKTDAWWKSFLGC